MLLLTLSSISDFTMTAPGMGSESGRSATRNDQATLDIRVHSFAFRWDRLSERDCGHNGHLREDICWGNGLGLSGTNLPHDPARGWLSTNSAQGLLRPLNELPNVLFIFTTPLASANCLYMRESNCLLPYGHITTGH